MATCYTDLFTQAELELLLDSPEVLAAKEQLVSGPASVSFQVQIPSPLKQRLEETWGVSVPAEGVPMRWIKGDTRPHRDRGARTFDRTHLAYLTDSPGTLLVGEEEYPIAAGFGYVFPEGLSHETVGTGTEPRLLLGPMSEGGLAVGGAGIYAPGGTTVYIRQTAIGQQVEVSTDQTNWDNIPAWGCPVVNNDTAAGILTIEFTTDITIDSSIGGIYGYFMCQSDNIQFGSTSLNPDGSRPVITIDGVTGYQGLIQNGSDGGNGYNNITIYNLEVRAANGANLDTSSNIPPFGGGWVGQMFFGRGATENYIINCHSTGEIAANAGGIVGSYAGCLSGNLTVIGCSSSGQIGVNAGGICGMYAANDSNPGSNGEVTCTSCWSTGEIGVTAGGIIGSTASVVTVSNCYSSGAINSGGGGICGSGCGFGGQTTISNCYSTGNIGTLSSTGRAGGIAGTNSRTITITNCYVTGNLIVNNSSGILGGGLSGSAKTISNCYTTGTVTDTDGYIARDLPFVNGVSGDYTLINNYSEAANTSSGWNTTHAVTVLTGVPSSPSVVGTTWVATTVNQPFELKLMGYRPYSVANITTNPSPSLIRTSFGSVAPGGTTGAAIVSGVSYTILEKPSGAETITIDAVSGAISTTTATPAGVYLLWIRNTGSYNITVYELTVTAAGSGIGGTCCASRAALRRVDYTTRAGVLAGNAMIASGFRGPMSHEDYLRMKKAKAFRF